MWLVVFLLFVFVVVWLVVFLGFVFGVCGMLLPWLLGGLDWSRVSGFGAFFCGGWLVCLVVSSVGGVVCRSCDLWWGWHCGLGLAGLVIYLVVLDLCGDGIIYHFGVLGEFWW